MIPGRLTVIAEAGVNHNGDEALAHELIDVAARSGADAVKFQTFDPALLVSGHAETTPYQRDRGGAPDQQSLLAALTLPTKAWVKLRDHAEERGTHLPQHTVRPGECATARRSRGGCDQDVLRRAHKHTVSPGHRGLRATDAGVHRDGRRGRGGCSRLCNVGVAVRDLPALRVGVPCPHRPGQPQGDPRTRQAARDPGRLVRPHARLHERRRCGRPWRHSAGEACDHRPLAPRADHAASLEPDELAAYVAVVRTHRPPSVTGSNDACRQRSRTPRSSVALACGSRSAWRATPSAQTMPSPCDLSSGCRRPSWSQALGCSSGKRR